MQTHPVFGCSALALLLMSSGQAHARPMRNGGEHGRRDLRHADSGSNAHCSPGLTRSFIRLSELVTQNALGGYQSWPRISISSYSRGMHYGRSGITD
jgi:hypothetical protein